MDKAGFPSRSASSHYLPRLQPEFYQADAVVFWTLPIAAREKGWLNTDFHAAFREVSLHAASRERLVCPAYCLMPDHLHLVWMGLRLDSDQRRAMRFFREHLGRHLRPYHFQHQAYDHVLSQQQRAQNAFARTCDYTLANPCRAGLVRRPEDWCYSGALIPGYPACDPRSSDFWLWFWKTYHALREPGIEKRVLPPRIMTQVRV